MGGTCDEPDADQVWDAAIGKSVLTAIRWKPVKSIEPEPVDISGARGERQQVLNHRRRIIFNDDTYEMCREDANTPEGYLSRRLQPLVGTHVDTISWSVLGGWADAPVYDSKVQPVFGPAHGGPPNLWSPYTARNLRQLIESGNDPLQVVIDFAHGNGMELFASVRMNDCHDSFLPAGVTLWKKEHPEFLVDRGNISSDRNAHHMGLYVIAQDFSHREVRDRKFEIIQEVCRRYDIDGIDLNFMRHPVFFSRTMRGEPASDTEIEIMNELLRRIRRCTDEEGTRRGKPILVAAIVPDSPQLALNVGLDVKSWCQEDLIDILIPGLGYAPFTEPVAEFVELAHPHDVKVFPCINRKAPQHIDEAHLSEGFRGATSNWYHMGADGVFFWNLGTPLEGMSGDDLVVTRSRYYNSLTELGDRAKLQSLDKLFGVDDQVLSYYDHVTSDRPLPLTVSDGDPASVSFYVGDDVSARGDELEELRLVLIFRGTGDQELLEVRLNGHELSGGKVVRSDTDYLKMMYLPEAEQIELGPNTLTARLKTALDTDADPIQLDRVRLWVEYK